MMSPIRIPPIKTAFARLSTGTKMLLILSAALLPLGFVALLTSLDAARSTQIQRDASAQIAATLIASQIDDEIDQAMTSARETIGGAMSLTDLCLSLQKRADRDVPPIAVFDRSGNKQCQSFGDPIRKLHMLDMQADHVWLDPDHEVLRIAVARRDRLLFAETEIALAHMKVKAGDTANLPITSVTLEQGGAVAKLLTRPVTSRQSIMSVSVPAAGGRIAVKTAFQPSPIRSRTILLVLLPMLMWLAAAFTGWFIVQRLLLLPLSQLQKAIDRFRLGHGPLEVPRLSTPAHEIQELAASFAIASGRIIRHERELEEGLARQTKLTREVHHRVKNNLQVVSSLINLHARGVSNDAVAAAYAAIQRRVDALAVVHRNHFAELEENRGLQLRTLIGELASNLRASAPAAAAGMPIALNMITANVSQDVAVPVAFLITEVVELMMHCNPRGSILISLEATDDPARAKLRVETLGLMDAALEDYAGIGRFDRVITGLARQLRAPLEQDRLAGRFAISIAILP